LNEFSELDLFEESPPFPFNPSFPQVTRATIGW
jgi:hypothetical protein